MIVVSNTSPINNLAAISQLNLLQLLYHQIVIPNAVYRELTNIPVACTLEVKTFQWIEKRAVANSTLVKTLQLEIDEGEGEAIALAIELNADLLLIDERIGRIVASRLGLKFVGVLGILLEAKGQGLIHTVKPLLDRLSASGFWINEKLYNQVLNLASESLV